MGNAFSSSDSCQHYKNKIHNLRKELQEYRNADYLTRNVTDPYTFNGGKKSRMKKYSRKNKNTRRHKK